MSAWPGIEVVGHKVVYKGLISLNLDNYHDLKAYGISDEEIYGQMAKEYDRQVCVRRDRRIREVLDEHQMDLDGD